MAANMASKVGRGTSSICGPSSLMAASSLKALQNHTSEMRVLGCYVAAPPPSAE